MTCRNYIPGPNGDCQRCGEMRAGHAGSELFKDAQIGATLNEDGSVTPRTPVRAGHAGSDGLPKLDLIERQRDIIKGYFAGDRIFPDDFDLTNILTVLEWVLQEMKAGHAGGGNYCWVCGNVAHPYCDLPECALKDEMRAGHAGSEYAELVEKLHGILRSDRQANWLTRAEYEAIQKAALALMRAGHAGITDDEKRRAGLGWMVDDRAGHAGVCETAAVEDAIVSVIRRVGIKAGVAPEVYGAMCHEVRAILKGEA